jgi:hypothetical protein
MERPWVTPAWKVRRELGRLGQQLKAIPEALWEPFVRRAHDAELRRGLPVIEGDQPVGPKIAIVLCWQPRGLAPSFLVMLDHLVARGYAPFVISNAPLSVVDRKALQPRVWRTMERPNFGYDFGGYRDGLFMLRRWGQRPERLVILNDSIWFPLWPGDRTLDRAEAASFDVVGTILRQRDQTAFLESYFFSMRGSVLDRPGFRAFWEGLRLTSNKYKVIRRGERGFGVALAASGISFGPLFPNLDFDRALARLDADGLRQVLTYTAVVDPEESAEGAALAGAPEETDWEKRARAYIAQVLRKSQPYSAFPVLSAGHLGYPVLKKSLEPVSARWRAVFLAAVEKNLLPKLISEVHAEVQARAARPEVEVA